MTTEAVAGAGDADAAGAELRLAVPGIGGRMGRALAACIAADDRFALAAATARPGSVAIDRTVSAVTGVVGIETRVALSLPVGAIDCVVDFTLPEAVPAHLRWCREYGVPLVLGVTALPSSVRKLLDETAREVAVVQAANFSIGVNLLQELLLQATRVLGPAADVEIVEMHHRHKRDAPSGTALALGEAVARARGRPLAELAVHDRHGGDAPRAEGSIGFACLRGGEVVGEHTVIFATPAERVEFTHRAAGRETFAAGALAAANWICASERRPGLYGMSDVLGLAPGAD